MAASRFECPRCQTVFVKDIGGDAAFVECPSCGALALPAGDATIGDLSRALSGPQKAPPPGSLASTEAEQPATPSDPSAPAPGMFSALLEESAPPPPAPLAPADRGVVQGSARAPELDFDFGKDLADLELPAAERRAPPATTRTPSMATSSSSPSSTSAAVRTETARRGHSQEAPPFERSSPFSSPVHQLPPDAMAALAADAEAGPTNPQQPWSNTLSEEAFGDLEKAFDEMALKPAPPPRGALSPDEERFLRGEQSMPAASAPKPPPLRRVDGEQSGRQQAPPMPPGRKGGKPRQRPTHFTLSDEARRLAFVALGSEPSGAIVKPKLDVQVRETRERDRDREHRERVPTNAGLEDPTDVVRANAPASKRVERKPIPSPWAGLTPLRVLAALVVCGVLGGVGGALTAPKPKTPNTPRARAELKFGDGNRFYEQGRFDDALGAFRGAISIDPTFALAHRAKGSALAKLQRHDEAAQAYTEYLNLEPNAFDSTSVKEAIVRREGNKPEGGAP